MRETRVVTGDIIGKSSQIVMLGAHMDTHYVGDGAVDKGEYVIAGRVLEVEAQAVGVQKQVQRRHKRIPYCPVSGCENVAIWATAPHR